MEISVSAGSLVIEYLVLNRFYIQREGKPNIYMFFINTITWQTTICIFFKESPHGQIFSGDNTPSCSFALNLSRNIENLMWGLYVFDNTN